jgi:lipopolysaccharide assembly protein A
MRFLSTLFWALLAAIAALFSWVNWNPVTLNLWGNLQADIKLPVLLLLVFLLGFLPTWLIMHARIWSHRRQMDAIQRQHAVAAPPPRVEETDQVI